MQMCMDEKLSQDSGKWSQHSEKWSQDSGSVCVCARSLSVYLWHESSCDKRHTALHKH